MLTQSQLKQIHAAMRSAMNRGVDPLNSHEVMERGFAQVWRLETMREIQREARREAVRSESEANRWLSRALNERDGHEMRAAEEARGWLELAKRETALG